MVHFIVLAITLLFACAYSGNVNVQHMYRQPRRPCGLSCPSPYSRCTPVPILSRWDARILQTHLRLQSAWPAIMQSAYIRYQGCTGHIRKNVASVLRQADLRTYPGTHMFLLDTRHRMAVLSEHILVGAMTSNQSDLLASVIKPTKLPDFSASTLVHLVSASVP